MHPARVSNITKTGVDFNHFIQSTIQKKMPWNSLAFFLIHLAPTLEKSQEVIEILVKELELWVTKVERDKMKASEVSAINSLNVDYVEPFEKPESDDESIVSVPDMIEDEVKNMDDVVFVKEEKEQLNHESAKELGISSRRQVEQMASRFYEFIGSDETVSRDTNEVLSNLEKEDSVVAELENQNEPESSLIDVREEKKNQCKFCDKSFAKSFLKDQHERIHTGQRPFKCKSCPKAFNHRGTLNRHQKIHSDEKPYQCQTCKKSFRLSSDLKTHARIHEGKNQFRCEICKKSFFDKSTLNRHERTHSGEKPFECKTCKKSFRARFNLTTHERIHTGELPFACKTCKKGFKQKCDLNRHERIHTGEVPYECETCKKRFNRIENLKVHERTHKGEEKPYECKTCFKAFNHSSTLTIHERIHSGEVPYKCKTCDKRFKSRQDLKYHQIKTHHNEESKK